jgi:DNA polymerase III delta prime subunit
LIFSSEPFKNYGKSNLVRSIRDKRNQIFHNPNFSISNEEFEFLWTEISNAMIELGYSKENLDRNKIINTKSIMSNILTEEKAKQIKNEAYEEIKKGNFQKAIDLYSSALILTGLSENDAGIFYSNRSFGYLKLNESNSKNKIDQRNLMRALNDAQMAIN